jgi:hypothetical protein
MTRARKILIALDQLFGTLLFAGIGPDETISAYCWRKQYRVRVWLLDLVFGAGHCQDSYRSEQTGAHLDPDYRRIEP